MSNLYDEKDKKQILEAIGWWACFIPVVACYWFMLAFTGMCVWNWLAAKTLGVNEITLAQTFGLMIVGQLFTGTWYMSARERTNGYIRTVCERIGALATMLLTAYLLRMWL